MRRVSLKAVLIGGVLDIVLSNLTAIPMLIYAAIRLETWKLPESERGAAMVAALTTDPGLFATGMFVGSLCSIVGGYLAARIAKHDAVLNGAASAWLCVLFGLYSMVAGTDPMPLWAHLLFLPMSPALGAIGGHLWLLRNRPPAGDALTAAP